MHSSRLVVEIEQLGARERERFQQFVNSPYFNQHEKTSQLLIIIYDGLAEKDRLLERKRVYARLFPKQPFREQALFDVMSYLMKLLYRFLAHEQLARDPFAEELLTLEAAYMHNRGDLLKARSKRLERQLQQHPHHDGGFYQAGYRLHGTLGYYIGKLEDRTGSAVHFQRMLDELDGYFIVEKLRNCCHLMANMLQFNTSFDFGFLEELLAYVEQHKHTKFAGQGSVELYYTILMTMREPDNPSHYERLRAFLYDDLQAFTPDEQLDLFNFATNYCVMRIHRNEHRYLRELFHLYQRGLQTKIVLDKGLISEWFYKNITALGCALKEFEWTERFLEEYRPLLPQTKQENAYTYNKATFLYHRKLYDQAEDLLVAVQFSDVRYHVNATLLRSRIYFEKRDTESLLNLLETFRLYTLRHRKITTEEKKSYTNFVRFAKKVALLKHQSHTFSSRSLQEKLQTLHEKIVATEAVAGRDWLLQETRLPVSA